MIGTALVPVAGLGTRLLPATKSQPKEMLPVGTKPVVQHVVEDLTAAGASEIIFVTGRGKTAIEDHFDPDPALAEILRRTGREELLARLDFERSGASFAYVRQPNPLGLGDAVLRAAPLIGGRPFLLALGDAIITGVTSVRPEDRVCARLSAAIEAGACCAIAVERVGPELAGAYGIVEPAAGERGPGPLRLAGMVEKPRPAAAPSGLAVAGRYGMTAAIFEALAEVEPGRDGELQLTEAIAALIAAGERVVAVPLEAGERRLDTGSPFEYAAAFVELALADPEIGPPLLRRLRDLLRR